MGVAGRAKGLAKVVISDALFYSGALAAYRRRAMRAAGVVLLYHRVVDDPPELLDYSASGISIGVRAFDAQMAYLRAHYRLTSLQSLVDRVSNGAPLDDGVCAVTFDDGWRDNYTHAFPILKKYGVPCTIFLTTNFIDGKEWFWEARLKYVLAHVRQRHRDGAVGQADEGVLRARLSELRLGPLL